MKIIRNRHLCTTCKACQLACSFHHTHSFWPDKSSIDISRNPMNGKIKWRIISTCDQCWDEEEPLCVKFCAYDALKIFK